jgi:hypothetical protein
MRIAAILAGKRRQGCEDGNQNGDEGKTQGHFHGILLFCGA